MRWLTKLRMLLRSVFERRQLDAELDEELREHIDQEIGNNIRAGMSQEEARRAANRTVGSLSLIKDQCREARAANFVETFAHDLRYGLRMLWRSPLFTLIALITLSIGIGATSAIFSVVNGVVLEPLPYPHPDEPGHCQSSGADEGHVDDAETISHFSSHGLGKDVNARADPARRSCCRVVARPWYR
jgi:hypothetical protein